MDIHLKNICKSYKNKQIFHQLDVTFSSGRIIGLIGPNGVGKTTLMKIMVNLDTNYNGTVHFGTMPNHDERIFKSVSFLQDNSTLYPQLSGYDHLAFLAHIHDLPKERIFHIADELALTDYLYKRVGSYSLGMKQNLLIAMASLPHVKCMIMDEPLNGLDPSKIIAFKELVRQNKEKGITQIISTHQLSLIQDLTDEAFFLKQGQLEKLDIIKFNDKRYSLVVDRLEQAVALFKIQQLKYQQEDNKIIIIGELAPYLNCLSQANITVISCQSVYQSLEDKFKALYY
ncbi:MULTISPECIES: ABC transporter ATP-binding protein [unclassified Granulicatella]|uniref:ABC transporter ATP-binding protein n=1 Tax=unclassified Granulicatella TaxID=2630493 RepID=UPI001073DE37|nr:MULTISPECIES: ABC transporter ATP-binding protein [unclassified Granulicatella]MBF0780007.1 ABC transporter ATP-binding protein [Granulicatella sp. 19428wC4_WM01]TFU95934.1 ABC transporter ATP-binding protein [Granulicatella sp. WM01]